MHSYMSVCTVTVVRVRALPELKGDVVRHVAAERVYLRVCVTPGQLQALHRLQASRLDAQ